MLGQYRLTRIVYIILLNYTQAVNPSPRKHETLPNIVIHAMLKCSRKKRLCLKGVARNFVFDCLYNII